MATRRTASTAVARKQTTEVATSNVPSFLQGENTGVGVSDKAEDNIVPMIKLLQKGSPQVNKKENAYIEGAEAGDIWLKPTTLVKSSDGILFQPCDQQHAWVEWLPERSGFVQAHKYSDELPNQGRPDDARLEQDSNGKKLWVRDNGNILTDTRYVAGLVWQDGQPMQFIIPFSGTGHTFAKNWNTVRRTKRIGGGIANAYTSTYTLKTSWTKNNMGDWYGWTMKDEGFLQETPEGLMMLEAGREFAAQLAKGEKRIEPIKEEDDDKIPF